MADHGDIKEKPASGFSFAPRQMSEDSIATSIASDTSRRRTQLLLVAASLGVIALLGLALVNLQDSKLEVQVSAEKADLDDAGNVQMEGLSYRGITKDGNDFVLLAETAAENTETPDRVLMTGPRARVDTKTGNPITIRANEGDFSRVRNTVNLKGRVVIVRPDLGYTLLTDEAFTNLDTGMIISEVPVRGFSPNARVNSAGMIINEEARDVTFTGKARLILNQGIRTEE
ncbi:MAG: LPS export ABC transporter periplasmic protein LptC [Candidatus Puniceispirillales bacterium]